MAIGLNIQRLALFLEHMSFRAVLKRLWQPSRSFQCPKGLLSGSRPCLVSFVCFGVGFSGLDKEESRSSLEDILHVIFSGLASERNEGREKKVPAEPNGKGNRKNVE